MRRNLVVFPLSAFWGCAPSAPLGVPRPLSLAADPQEYAAYSTPGSKVLAGQAFLTTRGGDVKLAAGRLVTLDPATKYAKEWFRRFGADTRRFDVPAPDSLFIKARRTTTANAEGRFRFSDLPAGDYIVRSIVTWETGSAYAGMQGGVVASLVSVRGERMDEIILNTFFNPDLAATLGVVIVEDQQLSARPFKVIAAVKGLSCQTGLIDPSPSMEVARANLVLNASNQNADAVAHVVCNKHGMSFRPNCTSRIECDGDAIAWL